jgi:hypothetical protein
MKKIITLISVLFINLVIVQAQEKESELIKYSRKPVLNKHRFLTPGQFKSSFVTTSLQSRLGFGITNPVSIPGIMIDEYEIFEFQGQLLYFNMQAEYQQRFTPWLALYATFSFNGRVGGDMSTILADGINTLSGGEIGWLIRLLQSEKLNLSSNINVQNLSGNFINVVGYFEEIIDDNPYPSVIKTVPAMSLEAGLLGAWGINQIFGFQFHSELGYGESFERGKTMTYYSAGFSFDADLMIRYNTPIGFLAGYGLSNSPEALMNNEGTSHLLSFKAAYTGSNDFELGAQYSLRTLRISSIDNNTAFHTYLLVLKFYF